MSVLTYSEPVFCLRVRAGFTEKGSILHSKLKSQNKK